MKVTIPEITDKELADLLKSTGMTDDEVCCSHGFMLNYDE